MRFIRKLNLALLLGHPICERSWFVIAGLKRRHLSGDSDTDECRVWGGRGGARLCLVCIHPPN